MMNRADTIRNMAQLLGWMTVLSVAAFCFRSAPVGLLYLALAVQGLNLAELPGLLRRSASLLPFILQNGARLLFIGLLLLAQRSALDFRIAGMADATSVLLAVWSIAEISRFLYYRFRLPVFRWARYNLFLVCYPLGVAIELAWLYRLSAPPGFILGEIFPVILLIGYLFGFPYLFLHLYRSRKQKLHS